MNETWQQEKCRLLNLTFDSLSNQPTNFIGQQLCYCRPWETETIIGDGNCLFRCLSQIITGNQHEHLKIRSIIANFIASKGTSQLAWYFRQKKTTPCEYLMNENLVFREDLGWRCRDNGSLSDTRNRYLCRE